MIGGSSSDADNIRGPKGRSYKFAEKLTGRFFVSGVSGSFQKYNKFLNRIEEKEAKEKYTYAPVMEKHRKEELKMEAQRLMEIEEKLNEIQRTKEARRKRDRARRKKKMEYQAAALIQRSYKQAVRRRLEKAAAIMTNFLKVFAMKQAITATAWASSVLRRFFCGPCKQYLERKLLQREAREAAIDSWDIVQDVACTWTAARRQKSDEVAYFVLGNAMRNAVQKSIKNSPKKGFRSHRQQKKRKPAAAAVTSDPYSQFFFTEFDHAGNGNEEEGSFYSSGGSGDEASVYSRRSQYHSPARLLHKSNGSPGGGEEEDEDAAARRSLRRSLDEQPAVPKKKKYDPKDAKAKRLMEIHQAKMAAMEEERLRRLDNIEYKREIAEEKAALNSHKEELDRENKEKAKFEFFLKLEEKREAALEQQRSIAMAAKSNMESQRSLDAAQMKEALNSKNQHISRNVPLPVEAFPRGNAHHTTADGAGAVDGGAAAATRPRSGRYYKPPPPKPEPVPKPKRERVPVFPKPSPAELAARQLEKEKEKQQQQHPYKPKEQLKREYDVAKIFKDVAVDVQKNKKQEKDDLLLLAAKQTEEERYQKYSSAEALAKTRAAIKRRIANKMQRSIDKKKQEEEAEREKREKVQRLLDEAQNNLKKNIEAKKKRDKARKQALYASAQQQAAATLANSNSNSNNNRRNDEEYGSPSPPPLPVPSDGTGTGAEEQYAKDLAAWQEYQNQCENDDENDDREQKENGDIAADVNDVHDAEQDGNDDDDDTKDDSQDNDDDEEDDGGDDDDDEVDPYISEDDEPEAEEYTEFIHAQEALAQARAMEIQSSNAAAAASLHSNNNNNNNNPPPPGSAERERLESEMLLLSDGLHAPVNAPLERADINSAHEEYTDLRDDFEFEDFFSNSKLTKVYQAPPANNYDNGHIKVASAAVSVDKKKSRASNVIPKGQVVVPTKVPASLQNTPYFEAFKNASKKGGGGKSAMVIEHNSVTCQQPHQHQQQYSSKSSQQQQQQQPPVLNKSGIPSSGGAPSLADFKVNTSIANGLSNNKNNNSYKQQPTTAGTPVAAAAATPSSYNYSKLDASSVEDLMFFQNKSLSKKTAGKVDSLKDMISKARKKLAAPEEIVGEEVDSRGYEHDHRGRESSQGGRDDPQAGGGSNNRSSQHQESFPLYQHTTKAAQAATATVAAAADASALSPSATAAALDRDARDNARDAADLLAKLGVGVGRAAQPMSLLELQQKYHSNGQVREGSPNYPLPPMSISNNTSRNNSNNNTAKLSAPGTTEQHMLETENFLFKAKPTIALPKDPVGAEILGIPPSTITVGGAAGGFNVVANNVNMRKSHSNTTTTAPTASLAAQQKKKGKASRNTSDSDVLANGATNVVAAAEEGLANSGKLKRMSKMKKNISVPDTTVPKKPSVPRFKKKPPTPQVDHSDNSEEDSDDAADFEAKLTKAENEYEQALKADYEKLRSAFDSKLIEAAKFVGGSVAEEWKEKENDKKYLQSTKNRSSGGGVTSSSSGSIVQPTGSTPSLSAKSSSKNKSINISSDSEGPKLNNDKKKKEEEDDEEDYNKKDDAHQHSANQGANRMSIDDLLQFSAKDLLMTWALEDAMEAGGGADAATATADGGGGGEDEEEEEERGRGYNGGDYVQHQQQQSQSQPVPSNKPQKGVGPRRGRDDNEEEVNHNAVEDNDDDDDDEDYESYRLSRRGHNHSRGSGGGGGREGDETVGKKPTQTNADHIDTAAKSHTKSSGTGGSVGGVQLSRAEMYRRLIESEGPAPSPSKYTIDSKSSNSSSVILSHSKQKDLNSTNTSSVTAASALAAANAMLSQPMQQYDSGLNSKPTSAQTDENGGDIHNDNTSKDDDDDDKGDETVEPTNRNGNAGIKGKTEAAAEAKEHTSIAAPAPVDFTSDPFPHPLDHQNSAQRLFEEMMNMGGTGGTGDYITNGQGPYGGGGEAGDRGMYDEAGAGAGAGAAASQDGPLEVFSTSISPKDIWHVYEDGESGYHYYMQMSSGHTQWADPRESGGVVHESYNNSSSSNGSSSNTARLSAPRSNVDSRGARQGSSGRGGEGVALSGGGGGGMASSSSSSAAAVAGLTDEAAADMMAALMSKIGSK